jgi:hypothetical protein
VAKLTILEIKHKGVDVFAITSSSREDGYVDTMIDAAWQNLPFFDDACIVDPVDSEVLD